MAPQKKPITNNQKPPLPTKSSSSHPQQSPKPAAQPQPQMLLTKLGPLPLNTKDHKKQTAGHQPALRPDQTAKTKTEIALPPPPPKQTFSYSDALRSAQKPSVKLGPLVSASKTQNPGKKTLPNTSVKPQLASNSNNTNNKSRNNQTPNENKSSKPIDVSSGAKEDKNFPPMGMSQPSPSNPKKSNKTSNKPKTTTAIDFGALLGIAIKQKKKKEKVKEQVLGKRARLLPFFQILQDRKANAITKIRGKKRLAPKKKKFTHLKQIILQERKGKKEQQAAIKAAKEAAKVARMPSPQKDNTCAPVESVPSGENVSNSLFTPVKKSKNKRGKSNKKEEKAPSSQVHFESLNGSLNENKKTESIVCVPANDQGPLLEPSMLIPASRPPPPDRPKVSIINPSASLDQQKVSEDLSSLMESKLSIEEKNPPVLQPSSSNHASMSFASKLRVEAKPFDPDEFASSSSFYEGNALEYHFATSPNPRFYQNFPSWHQYPHSGPSDGVSSHYSSSYYPHHLSSPHHFKQSPKANGTPSKLPPSAPSSDVLPPQDLKQDSKKKKKEKRNPQELDLANSQTTSVLPTLPQGCKSSLPIISTSSISPPSLSDSVPIAPKQPKKETKPPENKKELNPPISKKEANPSSQKKGESSQNKQAEIPYEKPKFILHSRKFREYCDHFVTPQIDALVKKLLEEIHFFQLRQVAKDAMKAKKRYVIGINEVQRQLELSKVKLLIVPPNVEKIKSEGGLDDIMGDIISGCRKQGVPLVFALHRHALARILHVKGMVSVVAVLQHDGASEFVKEIIDLVAKGREEYAAMALLSPPTRVSDDVDEAKLDLETLKQEPGDGLDLVEVS